jgi:hypothetical protein
MNLQVECPHCHRLVEDEGTAKDVPWSSLGEWYTTYRHLQEGCSGFMCQANGDNMHGDTLLCKVCGYVAPPWDTIGALGEWSAAWNMTMHLKATHGMTLEEHVIICALGGLHGD